MTDKKLSELLHQIATCAKCNSEDGVFKAHQEVMRRFGIDDTPYGFLDEDDVFYRAGFLTKDSEEKLIPVYRGRV